LHDVGLYQFQHRLCCTKDLGDAGGTDDRDYRKIVGRCVPMFLARLDVTEGFVHHHHQMVGYEDVCGNRRVGAGALHTCDEPAVLDLKFSQRDVDHVDAGHHRTVIAFQHASDLCPLRLPRSGTVGPTPRYAPAALDADCL